MVAVANQPPTRSTAGFTQDFPFQLYANSGVGNPFFYHSFEDDFDSSLAITGSYTVSKGSTGTAAEAAGDGGLGLLTTAATNNDYVSLQLPAAGFVLPQGSQVGKKLIYGVRLQLSDVTASAFIAGLCNTTATLWTAGDITDGVYFSKASGGTVLNLITASGGTALTWAIPTAAYSLANATPIDLGYYIDCYQNINVFVGSQLVGFIPQSGSGAVNPLTGTSILPVLGPQLQIVGPASPFGVSGNQLGPWTVSAANLNLTLSLQAGAAAAKTLTVDFHGCMKER